MFWVELGVVSKTESSRKVERIAGDVRWASQRCGEGYKSENGGAKEIAWQYAAANGKRAGSGLF